MPSLAEPVASTLAELQRELVNLRRDFDVRVASIERQIALFAPPGISPPRSASGSAQTQRPAPDLPGAPTRAEIPPETIAIIAAAVTSFLGKKVKIHHARLLDVGSSPWAQQGRAIIQASHNLSR
jgi:hypothetical protein